MGKGFRRSIAATAAALALTVGVVAATTSPVSAALPLPVLPQLAGNPNIGTDLVASVFPIGTGGTPRECAVSPKGVPVTCVENVSFLPSASPSAVAVTYAHWVFCRATCEGSLLTHELVHVAQFEQYGDLFGPMYLVEAAFHGTGCDNKWEKPAYQTGGQCL
jgi:hypothetical protein